MRVHGSTGSLKGKVLINSKENKEIGEAIRSHLKTGEPQTVELSEETRLRLDTTKRKVMKNKWELFVDIISVPVIAIVSAWQISKFCIIGIKEDYKRGKLKEFDRGYKAAKDSIALGKESPEELLIQCRNSLTYDEFDRGWERACKEEIDEEN